MGKTVPERGTGVGWVEKALGWRVPEQNWAPRNHMEWLENEADFHGELGKSASMLCAQNPRPFNETNKDIHASLGPRKREKSPPKEAIYQLGKLKLSSGELPATVCQALC